MDRTKRLLLGVGAVLVLAGCASTGGSGGGTGAGLAVNPDCPRAASLRQPRVVCLQGGNACGIPVEIVPDGKGGCQVDVNVDVLQMKGTGGSQPSTLFWWIATPGNWEFRVEPAPFNAPVIFKDNLPEAQATFGPPRLSENRRIVFIDNANKGKTKFNYKVRVYRNGPDARPLDSPDPAIFNDG